MKPLALALVSAAVLSLAACSTPTPYGPADLTRSSSYHPGYSDTRVENNRYRVTFAGNTLTRRETVETYLLYRAAELTLENGYDWFEVISSGVDETRRRSAVGPDPYMSPFAWRFYYGTGWGAWGFGYQRDFIESSRYEATAEIVMHKGEKPADKTNAYTAREVKSNLEGKIVRPEVASAG